MGKGTPLERSHGLKQNIATRLVKFGQLCKRRGCGNRPRAAPLTNVKGHQQAGIPCYLYVSAVCFEESNVSFHRSRGSVSPSSQGSREVAEASITSTEVVEATSKSIEVMQASVEVVEAPLILQRRGKSFHTSFHRSGGSFHKLPWK